MKVNTIKQVVQGVAKAKICLEFRQIQPFFAIFEHQLRAHKLSHLRSKNKDPDLESMARDAMHATEKALGTSSSYEQSWPKDESEGLMGRTAQCLDGLATDLESQVNETHRWTGAEENRTTVGFDQLKRLWSKCTGEREEEVARRLARRIGRIELATLAGGVLSSAVENLLQHARSWPGNQGRWQQRSHGGSGRGKRALHLPLAYSLGRWDRADCRHIEPVLENLFPTLGCLCPAAYPVPVTCAPQVIYIHLQGKPRL